MCATNYNSLCFTVIPRVYVKKSAIIFRIDQKPPLKKFDKRFASQLWQHLTQVQKDTLVHQSWEDFSLFGQTTDEHHARLAICECDHSIENGYSR